MEKVLKKVLERQKGKEANCCMQRGQIVAGFHDSPVKHGTEPVAQVACNLSAKCSSSTFTLCGI
jgi:hypothetical protein